MIRVLSGLTTGLICSVCLLTTSLAYGQQYPGMSGANGYMNAGGYAPGQPYSGQPMAQPYGGQPMAQPYGGQPGSRSGVTPAYMASPAQLMQGFGGEQVGPGSFRRQSGQRVASRFAPAARPQQQARWFDVAVDAVFMAREGGGATRELSRDGVGGAGSSVISLGGGDLGEEAGMRFTASIPLNSGKVLEFGYMGLVSHEAAQTAPVGGGPYYSVLSDFGLNPSAPGQYGFVGLDGVDYHSGSIESSFDSVELSFRRGWMDPNTGWQGNLLVGIRHITLSEMFSFKAGADASNLSFTYDSDVVNSITGAQFGADFWKKSSNGIEFGIGAKVGAYGNRMKVDSAYAGSAINPGYSPAVQNDDDVAFVFEANAMLNWAVNQNVTVRAGYQIVYIDGLALGSEQFSESPPFVSTGTTGNSGFTSNGDLLYRGFSVGMEWMW